MKTALITGITGQDGAYLSRLLLDKGYLLHGISRDADVTSSRFYRLKSIIANIEIYSCDLLNFEETNNLVQTVMPDEVYHLASDVDASVDYEKDPVIFNTNFVAGLNLLRAIKENNPKSRIYIAGSSLMFGTSDKSPQNEITSMNPTTPYGIAKVAQYHFAKMYRETHGIYVCTGILYNHESPIRDIKFLPRKISNAVAEILLGKNDRLTLGNLDARRDWSFAGDIVLSMWKMLQQEVPRDFVIGSGEQHSIKELLDIAFEFAGLDWRDYVHVDPTLFRSVEYDNLCADISSANRLLDWRPQVTFRQLIETMTKSDMELLSKND